MKITENEKFVLNHLLKKPVSTNSEISKKLNITSQAIGKIRQQLIIKGYIKTQEVILDYEKLGIDVHALAMIKVLPSAYKNFKNNELDEILKPVNAIRSYAIPETGVTHIIIYAFRNIKEYDSYFRDLLKKFGNYLEIKHSFVFSSGSIIKSSSRDMFQEVLKDLDKQK